MYQARLGTINLNTVFFGGICALPSSPPRAYKTAYKFVRGDGLALSDAGFAWRTI